MSTLLHWFRAYAAACLHLAREPVATGFNLIALGSAFGLGLAAVVWLGDLSIGRSAPGGERLSQQVTLVLRINVGEAGRGRLERTVRAESGVQSVRFVGRDIALQRLSKALGDGNPLEGLGGNPLPDALVVNLAADLPAIRVDQLLLQWRARGEVEEVLADRDLADRLRRIGSTARLLAQAVVVLLLASGAVVVFNTIRLQLAGRQNEIELIRLLGAQADFVRRPFIARGTLLALIGAGLGWGLAETLVQLVSGWLGPLARTWGLAAPPASVSPESGVAILLIAVFIGWAAAWIGVTRHLIATDHR